MVSRQRWRQDGQPRGRRSRWSIYLGWLLLLSLPAEAQYRFDHWTAETGLPQNIITAIHQTPEGYLWVATLDGLARFDGVRFIIFNKSNTPGVSSNRFTCLYQDAQGDLWAGTEVGVITRYHEGQFITYANEQGLPTKPVRALMGDPQGRVWTFSGNKAREWVQTAGRFIERETPSFFGEPQKIDWNVKPGFWGENQTGLHLFTSGSWTRLPLPAEAGGKISNLAQAADGAIWIASASGRILRLKDGGVTSFPLPHSRARAARPRTQWHDRTGKIWEMEIVGNLLRQLTILSSGQPESIILSTLYEDREGNLWLGTDGQGLYRIRKQIVTTLSQEQGLLSRNVYPIYEDRAGAIWVGLWNGGLSQIKAGKVTNFTTRDGLSEGGVLSLWEDPAGRLLVATNVDLQVFEDGRFRSVRAQYPGARAKINVIFQDRLGAMWFGTDQGVFRDHNGQRQSFTPQDGLPGEAVRTIIQAADGSVWIGCYGGLMRWRDGKITSWTEQEGLPGNAVRALYEDRDGALWIGTYDSGLGRFKDGKFTRYTTREGLSNDGVFQILEDDYGNLWMSSNRGIYRVRKQELNEFAAGQRREINSIAFGKNDGMRNVECNGGLWPAGVRARDGKLWFPTQDGVAVIDPAAVTTNQSPPPILIESVLLDRTLLASRDEVQMQPGEGNLEIQYTALSFTNAASARFKYKVEGLDPDWIDAGTRRAAFFSYLPPGKYTFKVIAANSDGVWNTEGKSLRIIVVPPFYRRWWFISLAALAVTGLVLAAFKYRVRQLEERQAAQQAFSRQLIESQEVERKRIAAELHDSLGQNLLIVKNWALIGLNTLEASNPARESLAEISSTTSLALEEVRSIAHDLRPYQLERLGLTNTLEFMLHNVKTSSDIEFSVELENVDGLLSPEAEINLYRIVQELINNVIKHSEAAEAWISVRRVADEIQLVCRDNGKGFDPAAAARSRQSGMGLSGLAERVRILGGRYTIDSAPGGGTKITIHIETTRK